MVIEMDPTVALANQPTPVLVALWRHLKCPVDPSTGQVTPVALRLIQMLHGRGYPLRSLL